MSDDVGLEYFDGAASCGLSNLVVLLGHCIGRDWSAPNLRVALFFVLDLVTATLLMALSQERGIHACLEVRETLLKEEGGLCIPVANRKRCDVACSETELTKKLGSELRDEEKHVALNSALWLYGLFLGAMLLGLASTWLRRRVLKTPGGGAPARTDDWWSRFRGGFLYYSSGCLTFGLLPIASLLSCWNDRKENKLIAGSASLIIQVVYLTAALVAVDAIENQHCQELAKADFRLSKYKDEGCRIIDEGKCTVTCLNPAVSEVLSKSLHHAMHHKKMKTEMDVVIVWGGLVLGGLLLSYLISRYNEYHQNKNSGEQQALVGSAQEVLDI